MLLLLLSLLSVLLVLLLFLLLLVLLVILFLLFCRLRCLQLVVILQNRSKWSFVPPFSVAQKEVFDSSDWCKKI